MKRILKANMGGGSKKNIASFYADGKNKLARPHPLKAECSDSMSSNDSYRSFSKSPQDLSPTEQAHLLSMSHQNRLYSQQYCNPAYFSSATNPNIYLDNHHGQGNGNSLNSLSQMNINKGPLSCVGRNSNTLMDCRDQRDQQVKQQHNIMVDQSTGLCGAQLVVVSNDFYAAQNELMAAKQKAYNDFMLSLNSLEKKSMKVKTFKCPLPEVPIGKDEDARNG